MGSVQRRLKDRIWRNPTAQGTAELESIPSVSRSGRAPTRDSIHEH